jgi:thymidylate synthase
MAPHCGGLVKGREKRREEIEKQSCLADASDADDKCVLKCPCVLGWRLRSPSSLVSCSFYFCSRDALLTLPWCIATYPLACA